MLFKIAPDRLNRETAEDDKRQADDQERHQKGDNGYFLVSAFSHGLTSFTPEIGLPFLSAEIFHS
jgi:hypothetical protein